LAAGPYKGARKPEEVLYPPRVLVATLLIGLGGCDSTGTDLAMSDDDPSAPDLQDHRVRGDGEFLSDYFTGWFSLTASARASGGVAEGEIRLVGPDNSPTFAAPVSAEVSCLSVMGNQAWVGAVVTDGFLGGWGLVFGVRDNSGDGVPDQRSRIEWSSTGYADCLSFHPVVGQPLVRGDFKVW
jgi:hypothetical protein